MAWLANGYTVGDYDGGSRTKYLDPGFIDYPPIPEDEEEIGNSVNGMNGVNGGKYEVDKLLPQAFTT
jgi:hypothetical protein